MKTSFRFVSRLTLLAAPLLGASAARADIIFNLTNVTLSSAPSGGTALGSLTGSFTTNDARSMIVTYDITAPASGAFAGFRYTPLTSSVTASSLPSQYFRLDSTGNVDELQLYFPSTLTATGGTVGSSSSSEHEPSGGNRYASGSVQAAPEPSVLAALGLGAVALVRRRQRA